MLGGEAAGFNGPEEEAKNEDSSNSHAPQIPQLPPGVNINNENPLLNDNHVANHND